MGLLLIFLITRDEIIDEAWKYVNVEWVCGEDNSTKWQDMYEKYGCSLHKRCDFEPGKSYTGVAYGFGQNDSYVDFLDKLSKGYAAGNHLCHYTNYGEETGIYPPDWATGIDCSAFVCRVWRVPRTSSTGLYERYRHIDKSETERGDVLTYPGHHTVLIVDPGENPPEGFLYIMEAAGSATRTVYRKALWAEFKDYTAITLFEEKEPERDTALPYSIKETIVRNSLELTLGEKEIDYTIRYRIYNTAGFEVKRGFIFYENGKGKVDVSDLIPSIYVIHVYIGDYLRRFYFIKIRS